MSSNRAPPSASAPYGTGTTTGLPSLGMSIAAAGAELTAAAGVVAAGVGAAGDGAAGDGAAGVGRSRCWS